MVSSTPLVDLTWNDPRSKLTKSFRKETHCKNAVGPTALAEPLVEIGELEKLIGCQKSSDWQKFYGLGKMYGQQTIS